MQNITTDQGGRYENFRILRKEKYLGDAHPGAPEKAPAVPDRFEIGDRFVADYELRAFARVLGVEAAWLLGMDHGDA